MSILESFNCHLPVMLRKLDLYDAVIADKYIETRDVNEMHAKLNDYYQHREKLLPYIEKSKQAGPILFRRPCGANVVRILYRPLRK